MIPLPPKKKLSRKKPGFLAVMLVSIILGLGSVKIFHASQVKDNLGCTRIYQMTLIPETSQDLSGTAEYDIACYQFEAQSGQTLSITVNTPITLLLPNADIVPIQDSWSQLLTTSGKYYIKIEQNPALNSGFLVQLSTWSTANKDLTDSNIELTPNELMDTPTRLHSLKSTSSQTSSPFVRDIKLDAVIDIVLAHVEKRGLPLDKFSISLVSLTSDSCCGYAGFNDKYPRYPASIVKLFWLVNLYAQYENGTLSSSTVPEIAIHKMIADSDNEPASRVLDLITQTESGGNLSTDDLKRWLDKRLSINSYFEARGYQGINLSQKTFPIPYLQLNEPQGRELQMRGNAVQPIRNYLTTYSTAQLLYEISTNQALSSTYSHRVLNHLKRDLSPTAWQGKPFNSIEGFLGESLPVNTGFYSKAGWMSISRNDASIIIAPDGKTKYILVVFGDDRAFKDDEEIFPAISKLIYQNLVSNP